MDFFTVAKTAYNINNKDMLNVNIVKTGVSIDIFTGVLKNLEKTKKVKYLNQISNYIFLKTDKDIFFTVGSKVYEKDNDIVWMLDVNKAFSVNGGDDIYYMFDTLTKQIVSSVNPNNFNLQLYDVNNKPFVSSNIAETQILDWLKNGERGLSSERLAQYAIPSINIVKENRNPDDDLPRDLDDLNRCANLLNNNYIRALIESKRDELTPKWQSLLVNFDELISANDNKKVSEWLYNLIYSEKNAENKKNVKLK
jgi:hypothetical protein